MRTTPHPTTKKSPAELMYNHHIRTRLPQTTTLIGERGDIEEAREEDRMTKLKQKKYKDSKRYVKPHVIKTGDQVLLKQKATKRHPPYDPDPYTVTEIHGHQITACRGGEQKTRDAQKWKKVSIREPTDYNHMREEERRRDLQNPREDIGDIDVPEEQEIYQATPTTEGARNEGPIRLPTPTTRRRYPRRERNKPDRFGDWISS